MILPVFHRVPLQTHSAVYNKRAPVSVGDRSIKKSDLHEETFASTLQSGATSTISITNTSVLKRLNIKSAVLDDYVDINATISREVCVLNILKHFPWCPALLSYGQDFIITSFAGYPLNATNVPDDMFEQVLQIIRDMQSVGVAHNDILYPHKEHVVDRSKRRLINGKIEFMVLDGKISLIDYGWATVHGHYNTCPGVTHKVPIHVKRLNDERIPYILREFTRNTRDVRNDSEIHLLLDWERSLSVAEFTESLPAHLHVVSFYERDAINDETMRLSLLQNFYGVPVADNRFKSDHFIYVLNDTQPQYSWRQTTKGYRRVNSNVFDLKKRLRARIQGQIHATDNIQETKENMAVLGLSYSSFYTKSFASLSSVFDTLNHASDFKYVVLRNFENLTANDAVEIDEHTDLDLCVSDYYMAKRLLDAESTTLERMEDGEGRVQNRFKVGDKWVQVDIRYVGDHYYDTRWEEALLESRMWFNGFFIPNEENLRYSLLYHALVHKFSVSETYLVRFKQEFHTIDRAELASELKSWMRERQYSMPKPSDPSVGWLHGE
ncbi:MAG: hypothetical protein CMB57_02040 [Euryarchaeota archaeon]|nr:hypothetical protein [Euryarchaeota archaeon]